MHYLRYLLLQEGTSPLPEELNAIKSMPAPQNMKEHAEFLNCKGYYGNHINHNAIITHKLTKLLRKGEIYLRMETHQKSFIELKRCLQRPLIFIYADPSKLYLITVSFKYYWDEILYQYTPKMTL